MLLAGVIAALPFLVSSEAVREQIVEQARLLTGKELSYRDAPRILFNPFLGIELTSIIVEDSEAGPEDAPLLQMERLRGQLDVVSALFGRVRIQQYQLVRPHLRLRVYGDGRNSWALPDSSIARLVDRLRETRGAGDGGGAASGPGAATEPAVTLGAFEIVDGTIEYDNRVTGRREVFTNVNARLAWPGTNSPLDIAGTGIWRDEAFEYAIRVNRPIQLMGGGSTALNYSLRSGAFSTAFEGQANTLADLHMIGKFRFETPSVRRLSGFLGHAMQPGSTLAGFAASGELKGTPNQMQLTDATVALDGNTGRGLLQIARQKNGRLSVNGTLAADRLDFTTYLAALRQEAELTSQAMVPGREIIDQLDLDLRLSASEAKLGPLSLADFAASLTVHRAGATLNIGNARLYGGALVGKVDLAHSGDRASLKVETMISNFDAARVSQGFGQGRFSVSGVGTAETRLQSSGGSLSALTSNLWGYSTFQVKAGSLTGVDFDALYRAAIEPGESTDNLNLAGTTAFEALGGEFSFNRNQAWIGSIRLDGNTTSSLVTGRTAADLSAVALRIRIEPAQEPAQDETPRYVQLFVGGSAEFPLVTRFSVDE